MKTTICHFTISLITLFCINTYNVCATDIDTIYERLYASALLNPSKSAVDEALTLLKTDGSFSDLDYNQTANDVTTHLKRMYNLAAAYQSENNFYYRSELIKNKYILSLQYWVAKNHSTDNWWFRYNGYPNNLWPSVILMNKEIKVEDSTLFDSTIEYLRWGLLQNKYNNGFANIADMISAALPASVLIKNDEQLKIYQNKIKGIIIIQNKGEGIEPDMMFGQHSTVGRQVYSNYGKEYLKSVLKFLAYVKGTAYDVTDKEIKLLEDHHLDAIQWFMYKNHIDPNQMGRTTSTTIGVSTIVANAKRLRDLDTPRNSEISLVYDRLKNGNEAASFLSGNKMFWRFDYMIHRRPGYYISSRMTSTRTVGMESGNNMGNNNYYGGAGINFIFRTGEEYESNYFSIFNYRQWPGITVEQDNATLPLVDWGAGGLNGNSFAGGVSNGQYGACGFIYDKRGVKAYKGWFYFENEFVALGNGITQTTGTAPVFTTVNQALQKTLVNYSKDENIQILPSSSGTTTVHNPDWILQDSIGYINLEPTSEFKISSDERTSNDIFTVGINHGTNPNNSTYAYAVYPNASISKLADYKNDIPIQILSNTQTVQAVYHKTLKITQAIFFTSGVLTLADGKIVIASNPCAIMIKDYNNTYQVSVSNPRCETINPKTLTLTINKQLTGTGSKWNGSTSTIKFDLPQGDYAGQTVSETFYTDDPTSVFTTEDNVNITENFNRIVYPNPASEHISLHNAIRKVEIINLNGESICFRNTNNRVDISHFNEGIYCVKAFIRNGTILSDKLIIIK